MNSLLMKHRPQGDDGKPMDKGKWEQAWNSSHYILDPLAAVLREMQQTMGSIRPDDFDCHNHYAKMVYEQARKQLLQEILDILPK